MQENLARIKGTNAEAPARLIKCLQTTVPYSTSSLECTWCLGSTVPPGIITWSLSQGVPGSGYRPPPARMATISSRRNRYQHQLLSLARPTIIRRSDAIPEAVPSGKSPSRLQSIACGWNALLLLRTARGAVQTVTHSPGQPFPVSVSRHHGDTTVASASSCALHALTAALLAP